MKKLINLFVFTSCVLICGCSSFGSNEFKVGENERVQVGRILGKKYLQERDITFIGLQVESKYSAGGVVLPLWIFGNFMHLGIGQEMKVVLDNSKIVYWPHEVTDQTMKGEAILDITMGQLWYKIRNFKTLSISSGNSQLLDYLK